MCVLLQDREAVLRRQLALYYGPKAEDAALPGGYAEWWPMSPLDKQLGMNVPTYLLPKCKQLDLVYDVNGDASREAFCTISVYQSSCPSTVRPCATPSAVSTGPAQRPLLTGAATWRVLYSRELEPPARWSRPCAGLSS